MKPSLKRALSLLVSAVLLVAALAVYSVLVRAEYANVQNLRGTLESKTQILDMETKAVEQVKNLVVSLKSIGSISDKLSVALPQDESMASAVAQINALAQLHGTALQGIGVSYLPVIPPPVKLSFVKGVGSLEFNIKFNGSYAGGRDFLMDLERNLRIMDVKNLKLQSGANIAQDFMNFDVTVDTYYQAK